MKLSDIKGIGKKKFDLLNSLGIMNVSDLANYLPNRYEDRSRKTKIKESLDGLKSYYDLKITSNPKTYYYASKKSITRCKATDGEDFINIVWYNDKFSARALINGETYKFYGMYDELKNALINPIISQLNDNSIGGIYPIYSIKRGLSNKEIISYKDRLFGTKHLEIEYLSEEQIQKYSLLEMNDMLKKLHRPNSFIDLLRAKNTYAIRELFIEKLSNRIYRNILDSSHIEFFEIDIERIIYPELEFELTASQKSAIYDIQKDMSSQKRMNRLVIGDVGSGKTVVGIIASVISAKNGYQTAFMAPTELLAKQHFNNYQNLLRKIGISCDILTGATKASQKKDIKNRLENNEIDVIFGTHALFQDVVEFSNLGLVILDEQQRFGVFQRKKLSDKGMHPDMLLLTATPIPRTMALSLYDDLDVSFIDSQDRFRQKIDTYLLPINKEKRVIDFALQQVKEGRQVYVIASRVENSDDLESVEKLYERISKYLDKNARVDYLHGKMTSDEKQIKQEKFQNHEIDILISTTIVEVGIDVKNANLIIIYDANQFGLSQLHQLRGRVGRGNHKSYCIFITGNVKDSEKLNFLVENDDGFEIARKDLELRGSGQIYGLEQSGFGNNYSDLIMNEKIIETSTKLAQEVFEKEIDDRLKRIIENRLLNYQKIIMN